MPRRRDTHEMNLSHTAYMDRGDVSGAVSIDGDSASYSCALCFDCCEA
jgi:hypothetical protein